MGLNKTRIYIIGTYHGDLKGERRLAAALEQIKPDIVTMEGHEGLPDGLPRNHVNLLTKRFIKELTSGNNDRTRVGQAARAFRAYISVQNYEVRVSREYAKETGAAFMAIEDAHSWQAAYDVMDEEFDLIGYLKSKIKTLGSRERLQADADALYASLKRAYETGQPLEGTGIIEEDDIKLGCADALVNDRDSGLSQTLRQIAEANPGKRIAYVCGAFHGLDRPPKGTIYSQLADLKPERILISDY